MRRILPMLFMFGCGDLPDADYTSEVCGIEDTHPVGVMDFNPPELSLDCIELILSDLNANVRNLEQGSGIYWEDLANNPSAFNTPLGMLVAGGYGLLAIDWGTESGKDLYVEMGASFRTVVYADLGSDVPAAFNPATNKLKIAAPLTAPRAAMVLVHELSHAEGTRHVPCDSHTNLKECDEGWGGAYTRQILFVEAGLAQSEDELVWEILLQDIENIEQNYIL